MKLIMENWRQFVNEQNTQDFDPCSVLQVQKAYAPLAQILGKNKGAFKNGFDTTFGDSTDAHTEARLSTYNKIFKVLPKEILSNLDDDISNKWARYSQLFPPENESKWSDAKVKQFVGELSPGKSLFFRYLAIQTQVEIYERLLKKAEQQNKYSDETRKISNLLSTLKTLTSVAAKTIHIHVQDFQKNNLDPNDTRSTDDQCAGSKPQGEGNQLFDDNGDWSKDLERIPQLIDQSNTESSSGRRLFGLLWRYVDGKHVVVTPGLKLRNTGVNTLKIQGFGLIRGYFDALRIKAQEQGYASDEPGDFEDWLSFWIKQGPVKGLDWYFTNSVSTGRRY
jgi:hypothetical protein